MADETSLSEDQLDKIKKLLAARGASKAPGFTLVRLAWLFVSTRPTMFVGIERMGFRGSWFYSSSVGAVCMACVVRPSLWILRFRKYPQSGTKFVVSLIHPKAAIDDLMFQTWISVLSSALNSGLSLTDLVSTSSLFKRFIAHLAFVGCPGSSSFCTPRVCSVLKVPYAERCEHWFSEFCVEEWWWPCLINLIAVKLLKEDRTAVQVCDGLFLGSYGVRHLPHCFSKCSLKCKLLLPKMLAWECDMHHVATEAVHIKKRFPKLSHMNPPKMFLQLDKQCVSRTARNIARWIVSKWPSSFERILWCWRYSFSSETGGPTQGTLGEIGNLTCTLCCRERGDALSRTLQLQKAAGDKCPDYDMLIQDPQSRIPMTWSHQSEERVLPENVRNTESWLLGSMSQSHMTVVWSCVGGSKVAAIYFY